LVREVWERRLDGGVSWDRARRERPRTSRRFQTFGRFARWETVRASSASTDCTAALAEQAQLFSALQPRNRPNNNDPFHVTRSSSSVVTYPGMELWQIGLTCAIVTQIKSWPLIVVRPVHRNVGDDSMCAGDSRRLAAGHGAERVRPRLKAILVQRRLR